MGTPQNDLKKLRVIRGIPLKIYGYLRLVKPGCYLEIDARNATPSHIALQGKCMYMTFFTAVRRPERVMEVFPLMLLENLFTVTVHKDKCNGDEECVNACPAQVFEMVDGKSDPVNVDECLGCETCVEVCPEDAITVTEV